MWFNVWKDIPLHLRVLFVAGVVSVVGVLAIADGVAHMWTFRGATAVAQGTVVHVHVEPCGFFFDACGKHKSYRSFHAIEYAPPNGRRRLHELMVLQRRRRAEFPQGARVPVTYLVADPGRAYVGEVNGRGYENRKVTAAFGFLILFAVGGFVAYGLTLLSDGRVRRWLNS